MRRLWMLGLLAGLATIAGCPDFSDEDQYACEKDQDCSALTNHTVCDTVAGICVPPSPDPDAGTDGGTDGGADGGPDDGGTDGGADGGPDDGGTDGGADGGPDDGGTDGGAPGCEFTDFQCTPGYHPCSTGCCAWSTSKIQVDAADVFGKLVRESLHWEGEFGLHFLHHDNVAGLWLRTFNGSTWTHNIELNTSTVFAADFVATSGGKIWVAQSYGGSALEVLEVDLTQSSFVPHSVTLNNASRGISMIMEGLSAPSLVWINDSADGLNHSQVTNWVGVPVANVMAPSTAVRVDHAYDAAGVRFLAWLEEGTTGLTLMLRKGTSTPNSMSVGDTGADPDFYPQEVLLELDAQGLPVLVVPTYDSGTSEHTVRVLSLDPTDAFQEEYSLTRTELTAPSLAMDRDGRAHVAWVEDVSSIQYLIVEPGVQTYGPYSFAPGGAAVDSIGMALEDGCNPVFVYPSEGSVLWMVR